MPAVTPPRALRSQPTRDRILAVARDCFASSGFERTTIRAIATGAGVAPAMVIRYYGSKEELFVAAARIDLRLPALDAVAIDDLGRILVNHFFDRWEGAGNDGQLQALLRASISHDGARAALTAIFETQLIGTIEGAGVDQPARRAALVASQMLGVALGRYVLVLPHLADIPVETLSGFITPTIQRYLSGNL